MFIIIIISLMLAGVATGYLARRHNLKAVQRLITVLIWILLFLLGTEVGHNKAIIRGLHTIGLQALVLTVGGVAGSVLAAWALWVYISRKGGKK